MPPRKVKPVASWHEVRDASVLFPRAAARKPLTERHLAYVKALDDKLMTAVTGPSGTAKTALAVEAAVRHLKARRVSRLVLTRPLVACDEELGFLPGTLEEKAAPFLAPMFAFLREQLGNELDAMLADGRVEVVPLAFMRGRTLSDAFVVADECQNATFRQLKMLLTRVGEAARMTLTGDVTQTDLRARSAQDVPLVKALKLLQRPPTHPDVAVFQFTRADVLRSGLVRDVNGPEHAIATLRLKHPGGSVTEIPGNRALVEAYADPAGYYRDFFTDQSGAAAVIRRATSRGSVQGARYLAGSVADPPNPTPFDQLRRGVSRMTLGGNMLVETLRRSAVPEKPPMSRYLAEEFAQAVAADPTAAVRMRKSPLGRRLLDALEYRPPRYYHSTAEGLVVPGPLMPKTPAQRIISPEPTVEIRRLFGN